MLTDVKSTSSESDVTSRSTLKESQAADDYQYERGQWLHKIEFLLACVGYSLGIGNLWRFPYLCTRNGGGVFLMVYLLLLVLCGVPLFFLESSFGQFAGVNCLTIYKLCPLLKGCGYASIVVNATTSLYFNQLLSLAFVFLYHSVKSELPWDRCNHQWNGPECYSSRSSINQTIYLAKNSAAGEFFYNRILNISGSINDHGGLVLDLLLANILSWIVVYGCVVNGAKALGKLVYGITTIALVLLLVFFVRGVTLPGAIDGIYFFINPRWEYIWKFKTWLDAALYILFSFGAGWGGIINLSSFNDFHNTLRTDAFIIPIVECSVSILHALAVFSVLGFLSRESGVPVPSLATEGPGLAFIVYPEVISLLPSRHLWAILFFILVYLVGLDRLFMQVETIILAFLEEQPSLRKHRALVTFTVCMMFFTMSLVFVSRAGFYYVVLFTWYSTTYPILIISFVEVVMIAWIYGIKHFIKDISFMLAIPISRWWRYCWKFVTPTIIAIILLTNTVLGEHIHHYHGTAYPLWSIVLGWFSCLLPILCIPIFAIYKIIVTPGSFTQRVQKNSKPHDWGPSDEYTRKRWLVAVHGINKKMLTVTFAVNSNRIHS